jgi:hypothetical protein
MNQDISDPLLPDVDANDRRAAQDDFGRHVVEQRNRMAALVRKWIESDTRFPVPLYDKLIERIRQLDASTRSDIASIALLMADQIVGAVLGTFDGGDDMTVDGKETCVNYAIVAQLHRIGSDEVSEQFDINRGEPVIAIWKSYNRWLSKFADSAVRAVSSRSSSPDTELENQ